MSTRPIGKIMEDLQKTGDDNTIALVKEIANASGSIIGKVKDEILSEAQINAEEIEGREGEYISLSILEEIILKAGDTL